jgi:hypothetical protein
MNVRIFALCGAFVLSSLFAQGQCNHDWDINVTLNELQVVQYSLTLSGQLTAISFDVSFLDIDGGSWPGDLLVHVYAPNGNCVVWGGYSGMDIDGGCQNLGTGFGGAWPNNWNGAGNQNASHTINLAAYNLGGTGTWTIELQNAWNTNNGTAAWNMDLTMFGICAGECVIPDACNYNPFAELANNSTCIFAEDLYPGGLLDCDGNCYNDDDGDGICNELEIPGCQVLWACNYDAQATDPPLPNEPCTYPENDEVDCEGNSLLPQFLSQPQDATVSCNGIPGVPEINVQVAPAAIAYHDLLPESCYDADTEVPLTFTESVIPGNCPGNYTIQRFWEIVDCNGFENTYLQTIEVVDNLPPVVTTDLEPIQLNCNDPLVFPALQYNDACGGSVSVIGQPTFLSLPGNCTSESTEKKFTVIADQCGNETTVEQTLVYSDDQPPFWLNEPNEIIITDNIGGGEFDLPVASDICSSFEVNMSTSSGTGDCPLSTILTRTFVAVDACGNSSLPFVQTIKEASDLILTSTEATDVTCHGGGNGTAEVTYEGGVGPYEENWYGYDNNALEAGVYNVQITDNNLCSVDTFLVISEPAPFVLTLSATVPDCNNSESGKIESEVFGGAGVVTIEWGDLNLNAVPAGEYTILATDALGCGTSATVVVPPAIIPEPLDLTGDTFVAQGDSAAYYYPYTLGSSYDWTYTGASEEEVLNIFAISLLWDSLGAQEVCVVETNQEGCSGVPVCLDVFVEDDVWNIREQATPSNRVFPNPSSEVVNVTLPRADVYARYRILGAQGKVLVQGIVTDPALTFVVADWPSGLYVMALDQGTQLRFNVIH